MNELRKKLILPKPLQESMLRFFLKTSIPRNIKLREETRHQPENK